MRVAPSERSQYYAVHIEDTAFVADYVWVSDELDKRVLSLGICHLTREAAQTHLDALIALNNQEGVEQ